MKLKDILKLAFLNVFRRRLKSLLNIFSITVAIAAVLLVSSIANTGENIIISEVEKLGLGGISIFPNTEKSYVPLYGEDATFLKRRFKSIAYAVPVVAEFGNFKFGNANSSGVLIGIGEEADKVYDVSVLFGRLPNSSDIKRKRKNVIIDDELAENVYKRKNVVGKKLTVILNEKSEELTIIGVIKSQKDGINQLAGGAIPSILYLPYTTLNELRENDEISQISVKNAKNSPQNGEIYADFLSKSKFSPEGYMAKNVSNTIGKVKSLTSIISLVISAIAGISLFVAGFGIMNTMLSAMTERRREIGICMAIGANSKNILLLFLLEAAIISLAGGISGAVIGIIVSRIITLILNVKFIFDLKILIYSELIAVILGVMFSVMPAYKASRMNPIDALRQN